MGWKEFFKSGNLNDLDNELDWLQEQMGNNFLTGPGVFLGNIARDVVQTAKDEDVDWETAAASIDFTQYIPESLQGLPGVDTFVANISRKVTVGVADRIDATLSSHDLATTENIKNEQVVLLNQFDAVFPESYDFHIPPHLIRGEGEEIGEIPLKFSADPEKQREEVRAMIEELTGPKGNDIRAQMLRAPGGEDALLFIDHYKRYLDNRYEYIKQRDGWTEMVTEPGPDGKPITREKFHPPLSTSDRSVLAEETFYHEMEMHIETAFRNQGPGAPDGYGNMERYFIYGAEIEEIQDYYFHNLPEDEGHRAAMWLKVKHVMEWEYDEDIKFGKSSNPWMEYYDQLLLAKTPEEEEAILERIIASTRQDQRLYGMLHTIAEHFVNSSPLLQSIATMLGFDYLVNTDGELSEPLKSSELSDAIQNELPLKDLEAIQVNPSLNFEALGIRKVGDDEIDVSYLKEMSLTDLLKGNGPAGPMSATDKEAFKQFFSDNATNQEFLEAISYAAAQDPNFQVVLMKYLEEELQDPRITQSVNFFISTARLAETQRDLPIISQESVNVMITAIKEQSLFDIAQTSGMTAPPLEFQDLKLQDVLDGNTDLSWVQKASLAQYLRQNQGNELLQEAMAAMINNGDLVLTPDMRNQLSMAGLNGFVTDIELLATERKENPLPEIGVEVNLDLGTVDLDNPSTWFMNSLQTGTNAFSNIVDQAGTFLNQLNPFAKDELPADEPTEEGRIMDGWYGLYGAQDTNVIAAPGTTPSTDEDEVEVTIMDAEGNLITTTVPKGSSQGITS